MYAVGRKGNKGMFQFDLEMFSHMKYLCLSLIKNAI